MVQDFLHRQYGSLPVAAAEDSNPTDHLEDRDCGRLLAQDGGVC